LLSNHSGRSDHRPSFEGDNARAQAKVGQRGKIRPPGDKPDSAELWLSWRPAASNAAVSKPATPR